MQQLMLSFRGTSPPVGILDATRAGKVSSFCLFAYNVESPAQVRALTTALRDAAREGGQLPPLIGIDQEGGQLIPIAHGATELPGNMALGATRSPELAARAGYVLGRELLATGINLNFAPALDIIINPANPGIGTRSFGDNPALVARLGAAMIEAMQAEGVLACAKHFPGHGDVDIDSHHAVAISHHPLSRLNAVELLPFRAAMKAGVASVMAAHIIFSVLDPENPASISRRIVDGLLRQDMGYTGLVITDALDMYPTARLGALQGARAALDAGVDLALLGHLPGQLAMLETLSEMENPGSVARITAARRATPTTLPPLDIVGCAEHRQIAQEIADRSITLVRDKGRLPLRPAPETAIVLITVKPFNLTPADTSADVRLALADAIRQRHPRLQDIELPYRASESDLQAALGAARHADLVLVATAAAPSDPSQAALVRALVTAGQSPVVIAMRAPYDIVTFPMVETYLCAYSVRPASCEAVARVLFGEIQPTGLLPCAIPGIDQTGVRP